MRTRMNRTWSMGVAAAFLMAMTSTLSAQDAAQAGMTGSSAPATPGASFGSDTVPLAVGDIGAVWLVPEISGWCGTDTSVFERAIHARIQLQLLASLIAASTGVFPSAIVMKAVSLRHWGQLTIDVPPPR